MLVVVGLDLVIGQLDRRQIDRDVQRSEIAGLFFQTGKRQHLGISDETAARQTGTDLADQHFLSQHLAELHTTVAQLTNHLVETIGAELAVHLEFRRLQDDLVQRALGESELRLLGALKQQLAVDQPLEGGFAQHFLIQQRGIEILAQLLHELATLHVDRLAQIGLGDLVTVDLGRVLTSGGGPENGIETGQRHQCDDDPDDGLGNPAL